MVKRGYLINKNITNKRNLGPLAQLVGEWEGDMRLIISHRNKIDEINKTRYRKKIRFELLLEIDKRPQKMDGLKYKSIIQDCIMNTEILNEVGYMIWDKENNKVLKIVDFGRGIAFQEGVNIDPNDNSIEFIGKKEDICYNTPNNGESKDNSEIVAFKCTFTLNGNDSLTYLSDIIIKSILDSEFFLISNIQKLKRL